MKKKGETKMATEHRTHRQREKKDSEQEKRDRETKKGSDLDKETKKGGWRGGGAGKPQNKPARGYRTERERKGHEAGQRRRERQKGRAG